MNLPCKRFWGAFVASALICALICTAKLNADDDKGIEAEGSRQLVQHIIARSNQIFSGRLAYRYIVPAQGAKDREVYPSVFIFCGPSWKTSPPDGAQALLSHGEKSIEYTITKQPDGSIRHLAKIGLPRPLPVHIQPRLLSGSWLNYWEEAMQKFLLAHNADGHRRKDEQVAGVACQVWEWSVAKQDVVQGFHAVSDLTADGGLLRLYCAPQLGYVLPRIEHVGPSGKVGSSYECRDYHQYGPGIFLPHYLRNENYKSTGFLSAFEYSIDKVEKINEQIPGEEFGLILPFGTEVMDGRPGHQAWYKISEDLPLSTTGLSDVRVVSSPSFFRRHREFALVVGGTLGLCAVATGWIWRSARRTRADK